METFSVVCFRIQEATELEKEIGHMCISLYQKNWVFGCKSMFITVIGIASVTFRRWKKRTAMKMF